MKDHKFHKEVMATLRSMKPEELLTKEREATEELFWLKFKLRSGQLEKSSEVKRTRRMLARIKTLARQVVATKKELEGKSS